MRWTHISGPAVEPFLAQLGQLRISVFREWPYLYDGTLEYEEVYLQRYARCSLSFVALVWDGSQLVGATTAMPMVAEEPEFQQPFLKVGHDLSQIAYFGESILLPPYRGRGLGKEFFARREAYALNLGSSVAAFCAVDRAADDPRRPLEYRALESFWSAQGYVRQPDLCAQLAWKETGEDAESLKSLTFWTKNLRS